MFAPARSPMSACLAVASVLVFFACIAALDSATAEAQPGRSGPIQQTAPATSYPGGPQFGSPYYGPNYHLLTANERELLLQGEISSGQTIGGGALSLWLGFGIGHAAQGRYATTGWKFTMGELAAIAGIVVGAGMAFEDGYNNNRRGASGEDVLIVSFIAYGILRAWEAVDAFVGPGLHNEKVRAARWKASGTPYYGIFVAPTRDQNGGLAGVRLRF